jgi:cellulose synthase/poly-beta-1,6-N-acetylglucosamine synthase-like glycosyltransferase
VLLSLFLTCFVALVIGTGLLLVAGQRIRFSSRLVGLLLTVALAAVAGEVAARLWSLPSHYVYAGQAVVVGFGLLVVVTRAVWNPVGQVFYATFLAAAASYLAFGVATTFSPGLTVGARVASAVLLVLEFVALVLSASFTFESCDAVCRTRTSRRIPPPDPEYQPMVSLHLATYNEPPDMLIETIRSLEAIDYPNYEIVVIDNNTKDPDTWRPVQEYCRGRPGVQFVHVDPWPGFKSGALNLALARYTHPKAEIIGVVDSDYQIDASWLRSVVGYFADPTVAFVQTPQDYREFEGDGYLEACYDAYKYFFVTTMPSRNQRNSIIFAGTMGLLRRPILERLGGWDEWCITEDAELSLRMLKQGYQGIYVAQSYGYGIMPLTFSSLKSQRFRWCFGGMQILRRHWRDLMPWRRTGNRLTMPQRVDYLFGSVQWMNDLFYFGFTIVLLVSGLVLARWGPFGLRPLYGAAVLLPGALILTGLVRAVWALRDRTGIGLTRAILAFLNWLSLSWTVAVACVQGLFRSEGVFLRTPKSESRNRFLAALWSARAETFWAVALWAVAAVVTLTGRATPFVLILFAWQGMVYASAPFMSWLNQHTELSAALERRRRTEILRERTAAMAKPFYIGALGGVMVGIALAAVVAIGGSNPGEPRNPFETPRRDAADAGPLTGLLPDLVDGQPTNEQPATTTTTSDGSTTTTRQGQPASGATSTTGGDSGPTPTTAPPTTEPPPATSTPTTAPPPPTTAPPPATTTPPPPTTSVP